MRKDWVSCLLEKAGISQLGLTREDIFSISLHKTVYNGISNPLLEISYFVCDEDGKVESIKSMHVILDEDILDIVFSPKVEGGEDVFDESYSIHP